MPGPPLPHHGPFLAHMTQPLEFSVHPPTKVRHAGFDTLCQAFGCADQMRSATLPQAFPVLIDTIPITDQDPFPVANELYKRRFGTVRRLSEALWLTSGRISSSSRPQRNVALGYIGQCLCPTHSWICSTSCMASGPSRGGVIAVATTASGPGAG